MSRRWTVIVAVILNMLGAIVIGLGEFEVLPRGGITTGVGGGLVGLGVALFVQHGRRVPPDEATETGRD